MFRVEHPCVWGLHHKHQGLQGFLGPEYVSLGDII